MNKTLNSQTVQTLDPELKTLISELINRELSYSALRFYSAKVVDNKDPNQLGRVRVRVFGVFDDDIPNVDLPWALPDNSFLGSMKGSMIVPPKNALVRVYFDNGDIYSPIYTTKIPEKKYKSKLAGKNYPDTMVFFETDDGDYFTINKRTKMITFATATGATITINKNGDISIDTTIADSKNGGRFSLEVNGNINLKTIGDITIDASGAVSDLPVVNPVETPDPLNPPTVTPSTSRLNLQSTGQSNLVSLNTLGPTSVEPLPDPTNPDEVALAALKPFMKGNAINIICPFGDINLTALSGKVKVNAPANEVSVLSPTVKIESLDIQLGAGAVDGIIKSNAFATFFDSHIHGTPSGPSVPPTVLMSTQLATLTSLISKTA